MRVTNNIIYSTVIKNLMKATRNLLVAEEVASSQKKINHPSDDPAGSSRVLSLKSVSSQTEQFKRNISNVGSVNILQDSTLQQVVGILDRAKELAISQAGDSLANPQTRKTAAVELANLRQQLVELANSKEPNGYVFSGYVRYTKPFSDLNASIAPDAGNTGGAISTVEIIDKSAVVTHNYQITFTTDTTFDVIDTDTGSTVLAGSTYTSGSPIEFLGIRATITDDTGPPLAGDDFLITVNEAGVYSGDSNVFRVEVAPETYVDVNLTGDKVFKGVGVDNGIDIFELFNTLIDDMRNNNTSGINESLDKFDTALSQIENFQSVIGSRANLLDNVDSRLSDLSISLETLISDTENIDITEAISDLSQKQTAYQASLGSALQLIKETLLDFLK